MINRVCLNFVVLHIQVNLLTYPSSKDLFVRYWTYDSCKKLFLFRHTDYNPKTFGYVDFGYIAYKIMSWFYLFWKLK